MSSHRAGVGPGLSPRAIHLLKRLLRLLSLEDVAVPDSVEAGCFAAVDPADPAVEEICLLVDGLRAATEQTVTACERAAPQPTPITRGM